MLDDLRWMWQKVVYKARYVRRAVLTHFGYCHRCGERMSYTPAGRAICTNMECGGR